MSNYTKCYPKEVDNLIIQRIKEGNDYKKILKELKNKNWYESTYSSFKSYAWELKKKTGLIEHTKSINDKDKELLKFLDNKKSIKLNELSKELSIGKKDLERSIQRCRKNGHEVVLDNNLVFISKQMLENQRKFLNYHVQK